MPKFRFDPSKYVAPKEQIKEKPETKTGLGAVFNVQEIRVKRKSFTNDSKMGLAFNNQMLLPDGFKEFINEEKRRLDDSTKPLVEFV